MLIKMCEGYELEKEKPNTSEDFFNRSEITYIVNGKERTLSVLYVRFFDQSAMSLMPFEHALLFTTSNGRSIFIKDIVAMVCLFKNPEFSARKRVYINTEKEFTELFSGFDHSKLPEVFETLENKGGYEWNDRSAILLQS